MGHASNANISTWENSAIVPEPEIIKRLGKALKCETWELFEDVTLPHDELRWKPGNQKAGATATASRPPAALPKARSVKRG